MNKSTLNFCPVPQEQQPIYEYEQLKESWLFNWGILATGKYVRKIIWVSFWSLLIVAPLSMSIYTPIKNPWELVLSSIIGVALLTGLFLSRIYLGWQYVKNRLKSDRIFYEESGWYDGQTWLKPSTMLNRDRLIVSYEIEPIMARLQKTYGLIVLIVASCSLIWLVKA
ncbi:MAG: CGLD27 family protein [Cyanobacteria bacterium P01_A01_bin.83]